MREDEREDVLIVNFRKISLQEKCCYCCHRRTNLHQTGWESVVAQAQSTCQGRHLFHAQKYIMGAERSRAGAITLRSNPDGLVYVERVEGEAEVDVQEHLSKLQLSNEEVTAVQVINITLGTVVLKQTHPCRPK
jgi:allantoicase